MKIKRHHRVVPELQMAAMPDLIFTVLFFFMIVTHMRENDIKVEYHQPVGENLVKVTNKAAVINIYVGRSFDNGEYEVQVGNDIVSLNQLPNALRNAREEIPSDQMDNLCVSLLADKDVPMNYINKVKMALREAKILKVNYNANQKKENEAISPITR